jgi:hypothetical protein
MRIDKIIKAAFEREVEKNRSGTPPFPSYGYIDSGKKAIKENRRNHIVEISLAACFIIVFGISVFLKNDVLRSPLVNQGASIAQVFPENPGTAIYDFVLAINSSFCRVNFILGVFYETKLFSFCCGTGRLFCRYRVYVGRVTEKLFGYSQHTHYGSIPSCISMPYIWRFRG